MQNWLFGLVCTLVAVSSLANNTQDISECVINSDCATDRVCAKNECINPCAGVCGSHTVCHVTNHVAMCSCSPGYSGHPILGCNPLSDVEPGHSSVCIGHDQCPASKACIQGKCRNPCDDLCGDNTLCNVVHHVPACACEEGHTGNPFFGCTSKVKKETWLPAPRGKKIFYLENSKTADWQGALVSCLRNNSRLASIDNMEELEEIRRLIRQTGRRLGQFWTSGSDLGYEGSYIWTSTGKPLSSTSEMWLKNPPQPDNWQNDENCVEVWERFKHQGYGLNDRPCHGSLNYICEYYS